MLNKFNLSQKFFRGPNSAGVSSIEMPIVMVFFFILMFGVYEVANYVQMASAVKNHVTTMTVSIAQSDVPSDGTFGSLELGLHDTLQSIIDESVLYFEEYGIQADSQFKILAELTLAAARPDKGIPATKIQASRGTLAGYDVFQGAQRQSECQNLLGSGDAMSYLGVIHTQVCISSSGRIGKYFGLFGSVLGVICRTACMPMVSKLDPPGCPGGNCCTPPSDCLPPALPDPGPFSGGTGCGEVCRVINQVDIYGYKVTGVCGGATCVGSAGATYDDMYMDLGTVGTSCGAKTFTTYGTCFGAVTTDCTGGCDCAAGSAPGAKCNMNPAACSILTDFGLELGPNKCNRRGPGGAVNDSGYTADEGAPLPPVTWDFSQMDACSYTPSHWECCAWDPEYGFCTANCCVADPTVNSTRCTVGSGSWQPGCKVANENEYTDCCESKCTLAGGPDGKCTRCIGKEGNNHCQGPHCNMGDPRLPLCTP